MYVYVGIYTTIHLDKNTNAYYEKIELVYYYYI